MKEEQKILGRRLRAFRKTIGLSRKQIDEKYGFSWRSLEHWESGTTSISAINLAKYIKIFEEYGIRICLESLLDFEKDYFTNVTIEVLNKT